MARRSPAPQRWQNRCCHCSPTDALIGLKVWCRLCRLVPVRLHIDTLVHLRVSPLPKWRPACGCDARGLCIHPDVIQYLADIGACDPSAASASQSSQSGGPRAWAMRGGFESASQRPQRRYRALLVQTPQGVQKINTAEVSVRPAANPQLG
jgi:hypothetical protein